MVKVDFQLWKQRLDAIQEVFDRKKLHGELYHYENYVRSGNPYDDMLRYGPAKIYAGPPSSLHDVAKTEETLGFRFPSSLRNVLLNFAGSLMVSWFVDEHSFLKNDQQLDFKSGFCLWNLAEIVHHNLEYESDIASFVDDDEEIRQWINLCIGRRTLMQLDNGDRLLIGIGDNDHQEIVYFTHDAMDLGEGHGVLLGKTFEEYIDRWMQFAFVGPEYWRLESFLNDEGLQVDGEMGKWFKSWFFD